MRTLQTLAVLLLSTTIAAAEPRIAIHSSNNQVDVTIEGSAGLRTSGLTLSVDGGAPVTTSQLVLEPQPIDIAFVWCRAEKWHKVPMFGSTSSTLDVIAAAVDDSKLAEAGAPGSTYAVIGYSDNVMPLHGGPLAELPKSLFAQIDSEPYECHKLLDAVWVGLSRLAAGTAPRKALIVLGDGVDSGHSSATEIRRYAAERSIDLFAMVIPRDDLLFPMLHEAIPNTRYLRPNGPAAWFEVRRTLMSISEQLRGRYRARFDPGLLPRDGELHRFDIVHNGQHIASTTLTLPKSGEPARPLEGPVAVALGDEVPGTSWWSALGTGLLAGIAGMAALGWALRRRRRAIEPCAPP
jgi:hypothetical protein